MEFDSAGNYVRGWGGQPADNSYEWPMDEHGIHVDYKGNVWVSSAGGPRMGEGKENFLLKFTAEGKFLLQIGRRGMSKGSLDTAQRQQRRRHVGVSADQRSVCRRRLS